MNKRFTLSIIAIISLLLPQAMSGQGVTNGDGTSATTLTIKDGAVLSIVGGGFTNNNLSSVNVNGSGEIQLDGNWTNNDAGGVFGASPTTGLVTMNGGAQTIGGTQPTNFYDLTVAGSDDKTMNVDVNVEDVLTLTTHEMIFNSYDLTLENPLPTAVAGTGGMVSETAPSATDGIGYLNWNIGDISGNYTIPFETASGTAIPVTYNVTTPGTGSAADPYKKFATYPTNEENTWTGATWTDLPTGVSHLTDDYQVASHYAVMDRFWVIDNDAQGNYSSYPVIDYRFYYDFTGDAGGSNLINEADMIAQRYNDNTGTWLDWLYSANANTTFGYVGVTVANSLDHFKTWTLVDDSDPLPIELAAFDGQCGGDEISLSWTTWTETKNDFFTLERSADGVNFEIVDIIDGAGNSNEAITYDYKDLAGYGGTSYYRLKDTDVRGQENYSEVIAVTCEGTGNEFNLLNAYENHGRLIIDFTAGLNEPYKITLMDTRGRIMSDESHNAYEGYNQVSLPVSDLAAGVYIVQLTNSKKQFGKRIVLK